jgi:hypothetical protein
MKQLTYIPAVGPEDVMSHMDEIAADIISQERSSAYLAVYKTMEPLTEDEGQRYVEAALGTAIPKDLQDRYMGYSVREYPYYPIHGEGAREVLAQWIMWCQLHHTEDVESMAFCAAIPHKDPTGWNLHVFTRDKIYTKLITLVDEEYQETTWDHRDIPQHMYTYIPNPFTASLRELGTLRGDL